MNIHNKDKMRLEQYKAECSKCSGLCCTALFFSELDGFPENKAAGRPCVNLEENYRCRIHKDLEKCNMRGCIGYDCFGAGQQVTEKIYNGQTWQTRSEQAKEIYDVFMIIFQLYQIQYFLSESLVLIPAEELYGELQKLAEENKTMCSLEAKDILAIDLEEYRTRVNVILKKVCLLVQEYAGGKTKKAPSDFLGKSFKNRDMSGLDLSMMLLIAADFCGCKFDGTILLGADMRDANLSNADMREAIFLSQGQINSARGNRNTKLPVYLERPVTWR